MQTSPVNVSMPKRMDSSIGKPAYCEIALRTATSKIETMEKDMHEMQNIIAELERRRHEAETKACAGLRRAQDSETRYNISDKRRQDAEKKMRELEMQITDAISMARQSDGTEDANRFDKIKGVFDNHAFEESKKRADAEHKVQDLMKKRAEAEAKCLEETERRVQSEVRTKQEMRIRIDEEMRNKALRGKLRDAEEKMKSLELHKAFCVDSEKRKNAEAAETFKAMLKQAHHSLSVAEQKRKEAELKASEWEQQFYLTETRVVDLESKWKEATRRLAELQMLLEQERARSRRELEIRCKELEGQNNRVAELQTLVEKALPPGIKIPKLTITLGRPLEYATAMRAITDQEENYLKVGELQTLNAELEVTMRELKENTHRQEHNDLKMFDLHAVNLRLEETILELQQRLEREDQSKMQLQATIDELEDMVREKNHKVHQLKAFENSNGCRRLDDSLRALRVEENPLFRREPVSDDLQRNFLSRPDSVTDESQTSPRDRPETGSCKSQQFLYAGPRILGSDEAQLIESPKSNTEVGEEILRQEKQALLRELGQNEALILELRERVQEGHAKQSELECALKAAIESKKVAEVKAESFVDQLNLAMQREQELDREYRNEKERDMGYQHRKERDMDYHEISGHTSLRGKKEKWGILDRFRSKSKLDIV